MPARPARRLPSGLIEGSPEANAAEAAESARLDRELGITPPTAAERRAAAARSRRRDTAAALRRVGIDLRGTSA